MPRPLWEAPEPAKRGPDGFDPHEYEPVLKRLERASGVGLRFEAESSSRDPALQRFPVRLEGRRTGWLIVAEGRDHRTRAAADAAAEVIGRLFTADQDIASLSMEVADRYEELNFLYEMGDRVGALMDEDEICAFVSEEAAWLLDCERASVMLVDPATGNMRIHASVGLPEDIQESVEVRPGERISGRVLQSGQAVVVNEGDPMPADALRAGNLKDSNCFLCVPLKVSGESGREETILGVINLTRKRAGGMFTASDLKLVSAVAATTATQIHDCRLLRAERERQRLEQELELAARIQFSLLPEGPLNLASVQAGGCCRAARHVGGDFFDYWVQDDHVCMIVADVSGHDIGASLMAAALRSVVRSEAAHRLSVAGLMGQVNRALFADLVRAELFISAFYAEVDIAGGRMAFCRAGHPKPLMVHGEVREWLDTEGMLLGLLEDGRYEEQSVQLQPGDTVVLYTDGLVEAVNSGGEQFGVGGVEQAALQSLLQPPADLAVRIVEAARGHSDGAPLADDMTTLVMRIKPEG